jgi:hypothetical protein
VQDPDSLPGEPGVAAQVVVGSVGDVVRGAVDFDREAERGAVKVEDVRPDRVLAPEAQAADLPAAQGLPEQNLRQCHGAPQRACALEGEERRSHAARA